MESSKVNTMKSFLDWSNKGRSGLIFYAIGLILAYLTLMLLGGIIVLPILGLLPNANESELVQRLSFLLPFIPALILIPLIVRIIHNRPWWSILLPSPKFEWNKLFVGFILGMLGQFIMFLVYMLLNPGKIHFSNPEWTSYIPLVIILGLCILLQSAAEEFVFRGYFMQMAKRIFNNPYFFIILPGILFSLLHLGNIDSLGKSYLTVMPYFIDAVIFGVTAYVTGSLLASIGLHWANNFYAILLVSVPGDTLSTTAMFTIDPVNLNQLIMYTLIKSIPIVIWLIVKTKYRTIKA